MFSRKKVKHWPILVFGTIFFAIIAATVVLIILLFSKVNKENIATVEQMIPTPDILFDDYENSLSDLIDALSEEEIDFNSAIKKTEEKLFEIRVPKEKREKHLKAILQLRETKNIEDLILLLNSLEIEN
jgi:hypothetical protein